MELEIQQFISYLENVKKTSENTRVSYERDLYKLKHFLNRQAVEEIGAVTTTNLNSYILYLEKEQFAPSTISRNIAAIKSFYHYLTKDGKVLQDMAEDLKAPRVEKKQTEPLTEREVALLLQQPNMGTNKGIRDKAMLELLYATGVRVSELIGLRETEVNLQLGYITCNGKTVSFGNEVKEVLKSYMETARKELLGEKEMECLFVNCSGGKMSRQGVWKVLKAYAKKAGIETEITPHMIRNAYIKAHLK